MNNLYEEQIWEKRIDLAIERVDSFDEYMGIPGYEVEAEFPATPIISDLDKYREVLEKRFEACKLRYKGMEEYMEIPDMDLWLKLKNEIIPKPLPKLERQVCKTYYTLDNKKFYTYDEFKTASIAMNSSDYVDYSDEDTYSLDSIDKRERKFLRIKDEWLEHDHDYDD